jgi:hypothetical protein
VATVAVLGNSRITNDDRGNPGRSWSELSSWHGKPEEQLCGLLSLAGSELCQRRRCQLRLEE